jgi:hypothetical protein
MRNINGTFIAILLLAACAVAQVSSSSINGQVTDSSGAVVANAHVEAKNEETGVVYNTVTANTGHYSFASLTPGRYTITVRQTGFRTYTGTDNVLTVGAPLVVDVSLTVGAVTEQVSVTGGYERLDTTTATVSDVLEKKQIQDLPLNGRNPLSLLTLEPGVLQRTTGAGASTNVFGSRDRAHNVTIDGIDANESTVPNPQSNIQRLNPDNVQEFRTVTLGATAETGRNSGANVMIATRAGSNSLHGTLYYFNRNTDYNANEWFNNFSGQPRPDLKLHQYGFDVGGPIRKNKTFFFGSFQNNAIKQTSPIAAALGSAPLVYTSAARSGIFRFVRGTITLNGTTFSQNDRRMVDANGNLLPGIPVCGGGNFSNCVDSYNIFANDPKGIGPDPAVIALINKLPLPNGFAAGGEGLNTGGFLWNPPTKFTGPHFMGRVDHTFNDNNIIFVRYLHNRYDTKEGDFLNSRPAVFPGLPPLGEVTRIGRNLAASWRRTITPNLVNELTGGFNRFAFAFTFGESNPNFGDSSKLPPWSDQCVYGSFVNIAAPNCVSPHTQRGVTAPQFIDNLSWIHGAHTFHAGINFRFYVHNDSRGFFGSTITAPGVVFNQGTRQGGFTNIPATIGGNAATRPSTTDINNLQQAIVELAGIPSLISQSYVADFKADVYKAAQYATVQTRAHQYDSYVQDEWKLRPNLTLNAGVRWEFNPAPYDATQALVPNLPIDGSQGPVTFVKADRWFKNDNIGAIGPRIGIAWSPDQKTAVRAGYALLFDTLSTFQVTAIAGKVPGFMLLCNSTIDSSGAIGTSVGCSTPSGLSGRISSGFPSSIAEPTTTPSKALTVAPQPSGTAPSVGAFDPDMKNPAVHEWSLTIQRELPKHFVAQIGYIGKRGTHLYRAYDLNQGSINKPGFLDSFNIARANFLQGCKADGTGCPTGVTGQTPTLLLQLVSPAFITSSTSATDLQRGNIGNFGARMDALSLTSSQRRNLPLNYFRPNPQFAQIFYQDAGGDSYYHGLFITARHRFESGLDFGFSYTYSKSIDDMSVDPTGAATGGGLSATSFGRTPTDVHNFRLDRARSDFDNRHVLLTNLLYELPLGRTKRFVSNAPRWLDTVIGGWQITGIFSYQSGEPYTINSGARTANLGHNSSALIVGPNIPGGDLIFVPGVEGPVMYKTGGFITAPLSDPHLNCQHVTGTETYFCIPPPGQQGSGRNLAQGPRFWNLDSGLTKTFKITERVNAQLRAEFFNVLNHPNFENPRNASTGSPTVTSTLFAQTCCVTSSLASSANVNAIGEPMRVLQLGLKINF